MSCETLPELFKDEVNEPTEPKNDELRVTLLKLADAGDISYTARYIKKASEKTLESIYKDYERQQLEETNNELCDILITKFSELLEALEVVDGDKMEKELSDNGLLRKDLKNIIGYVTPYIPMIGLLSGGVTVGKHVLTPKSNPKASKTNEVPDPQGSN